MIKILVLKKGDWNREETEKTNPRKKRGCPSIIRTCHNPSFYGSTPMTN
jgi:hypothetical protein